MLIDKTYFVGELHIAQLGNESVENVLNIFINKRENEYLRFALGYSFSKTAKEGMTAAEPESKWSDLKNGAEYTDAYGDLQYWPGFVNADKQSPLANYVYYWYMRDKASKTTEVAEVEDKRIFTTSVPPNLKQMRAWNEMVDMNCRLYDFLENKKDDDGVRVYDFERSDMEGNKDYENVNGKISLL